MQVKELVSGKFAILKFNTKPFTSDYGEWFQFKQVKHATYCLSQRIEHILI